MIKTIKRNIFSMVAVTYAFSSVQAVADINDIQLDNKTDFFNNGNEIKTALDHFSYIRTRDILSSDFEDGSVLEWTMNNEFEIFNTAIPFGYNDKGLTIHSSINEDASFSIDEDLVVKVKSKDLPAWVLSKYSTIEEVKEGVQNISVALDSSLPLAYEVSDESNNKIKLNVVDGNLIIS